MSLDLFFSFVLVDRPFPDHLDVHLPGSIFSPSVNGLPERVRSALWDHGDRVRRVGGGRTAGTVLFRAADQGENGNEPKDRSNSHNVERTTAIIGSASLRQFIIQIWCLPSY